LQLGAIGGRFGVWFACEVTPTGEAAGGLVTAMRRDRAC